MAIPPRLERELAELKGAYSLEVAADDSFVNIIVGQFPLGPAYKPASSDLLVKVPLTYPDAGPDMFWVEPSVTLADGRVPQNAESIEPHAGKSWRRFSWHHSRWNSVTDNMTGYLEFIRSRLRQGK